MTEHEKQKNIAEYQKRFDEAMTQYKANYNRQLRDLQAAMQRETDPQRRATTEAAVAEIEEKLAIADAMTMYDVEGANPEKNKTGWVKFNDNMLEDIEKTINTRMTKTVTQHANSAASMQATGGIGTGGTVTTTKKIKPQTRLEDFDDEPAPEPEPEPEPAAKPAPATTGRVTAAMKPAEFKPNYLKEETPKTEEEYLGKDPRNWKTMSKWERAAAAIGMIGDMGEDVIDVIAASRGLEHNGAKKLREAREKLQRDKEERRAQYREYLDKIEAENRRIREFNAGIGNQLAFQQFQADNEYNRQLNLLNEQARINRENGLYNTPL